MRPLGKLHSALVAGWTCLALLAASGAAAQATPDDPAQLLKHADAIKTANNDEFARILNQLDAESARLTPAQALYLRYFKGWQGAYTGDYATALSELDAVAADSTDINLRFRAGVTAINMLEIAARNADAYGRMGKLLDMLPQVDDPVARQQGLGVFAQLYNEAGQYDLSISYADKLLAENGSDTMNCKAIDFKLDALSKFGKLQADSEAFQQGYAQCREAGEPLYINEIRVVAARLDIAQGKYSDAIKLLADNYDEVQRIRYPELIADVDSALAQAYWKTGDAQQAQHHAQRAIETGVKNEFTEALVGAYDVLYQAAEKQGDYRSALAWHEKFAAADKGYLNLTTARTLAYQMVKQQVQAKKMQVDALSKQNQVLQLRQAVSRKDAEARDLYLVMLVMLLGSVAFWAWRTKRSEVKFMHLARRDGLTGIFNRQHFIEASGHSLDYCAKSLRDACVVTFDLDHFKEINDTHGHAAGDTVLKRAVAACQSQLRSIDVFGRLGGEEFGILMPDCVPERAADQAELIRESIAGLSKHEDDPIGFPVYASFGVSAAHWSGYDLPRLLAHADTALYKAKREGRNRVAVYGESTPRELRDRRHH
jgi:diguanylate cyclase (GGDEF)-like protein